MFWYTAEALSPTPDKNWLNELGFTIRQFVTITTKKGKLIVEFVRLIVLLINC